MTQLQKGKNYQNRKKHYTNNKFLPNWKKIEKKIFAFCVITFEPIMINTCSAPQNDRLNLSFVKDSGKLARNGQKMAIYHFLSSQLRCRPVQLLNFTVWILVSERYLCRWWKIGYKWSKNCHFGGQGRLRNDDEYSALLWRLFVVFASYDLQKYFTYVLDKLNWYFHHIYLYFLLMSKTIWEPFLCT